LRPLVFAGVGYRIIESDLDFPVSGYDPAVGLLIGAGVQKGNVEFRLGYGAYQHDAGSSKAGYDAGDPLDTSGIALELTYRFQLF
jgi:hypothetical protein